MSNPKVILSTLFLALLVASGAVYYIFFRNVVTPPAQPEHKPWVEVVSPPVFASHMDGSFARELKTGDELGPGIIIEVKKGGFANIYFPDGSVARLDPETKVSIDEAFYNPDNKGLNVKIQLYIGRVWSKIFSLATPESTWEVKTSNAVATVRGTAFGVAVGRDGKTQVGVTQNVVELKPVYNGVVADVAIPVEENKFAAVTNELAQKVFEDKGAAQELIVVQDIDNAPQEIRVWVEKSVLQDQKIETLREGGQGSQEIRQSILQEQQSKTEEPVIPQTPEVAPDLRSLKIISTNDLLGSIRSGTSITFRVILEGSGGTSEVKTGEPFFEEGGTQYTTQSGDRDVTDTVTWNIGGPIGSISPLGVFIAKLGPAVEEIGSASGYISASWQDPITGKVFLAKTPIFTVEIIETPPTPGAIEE